MIITAVITEAIRGVLNNASRLTVVSPADVDGLSSWFGAGRETVKHWFSNDDGTFHECVPPEAVGFRTFALYDANNPVGYGDGTSGLKQNMRMRLYLTAALTEGIERIPIFHGTTKIITETKDTLDQCLHYVNMVVIGNLATGFFLSRAWIRIDILPGDGTAWIVQVQYNTIDPSQGDVSDASDEELPEDDDGGDGGGDGGGIPSG